MVTFLYWINKRFVSQGGVKMRKEYFAIIAASIVTTLALDFFIDSLKTKEITTNALYLKNQTGKICAEFRVSPEGDPELLLRGGEKNHGMQLSLTQGTPSIFLYDDQTKTRAGLALLSDGSPWLYFWNEDERPTMKLQNTGAGPVIMLCDNSKPRVSLMFNHDEGNPMLVLSDDDGGCRALLTYHPLEGPNVGLFSRNQRLLWTAR
jgi:hypothetical protein